MDYNNIMSISTAFFWSMYQNPELMSETGSLPELIHPLHLPNYFSAALQRNLCAHFVHFRRLPFTYATGTVYVRPTRVTHSSHRPRKCGSQHTLPCPGARPHTINTSLPVKPQQHPLRIGHHFGQRASLLSPRRTSKAQATAVSSGKHQMS